MDFAALQTALATAVSAASGVPLASVVWAHTAQAGTWIPFPKIELRLGRVLDVGDDWQSEISDTPEVSTFVQYGHRQMVVEIRIETETQVPGADAMQIASRCRTRLVRESVRHPLTEAGLSIIRATDTVDAMYVADDRRVSVAVWEITCNAMERDVDTSIPTGDWVQTVEVETAAGSITNPGGDPIPSNQVVDRGD